MDQHAKYLIIRARDEAHSESFAIKALSKIFPDIADPGFSHKVTFTKNVRSDHLFSIRNYTQAESFQDYYDGTLSFINKAGATAYLPTADEQSDILLRASAAFHGSVSFGDLEEKFRPMHVDEVTTLTKSLNNRQKAIFSQELRQQGKEGMIIPRIHDRMRTNTVYKSWI